MTFSHTLKQLSNSGGVIWVLPNGIENRKSYEVSESLILAGAS